MRILHSLVLIPFVVAGHALAQSVDLALTVYQSDYTVYVNTQGANDSPEDVYSTIQTLMTLSNTTGLNLPAQIDLFCAELGQEFPMTPMPYTILGASAADSIQVSGSQGQLDSLAGIGISGIGATRAANLSYLYGYAFGGGYSLQSAYNQAVFQMAVWQLSHSDSFTLSTNSTGFYFSSPNVSSLISDTQALLTNVYNNETSITQMTLDVLHSDTAQDYILPVDSNGNFVAIPEPSAWAAVVGLASLGFVLLRRRATTTV